jgi:YidC/Oxa1 family membrane protein insertase
VDFSALTIQILKGLADVAGGYGMAIILLTVAIKVAMWPLSVSQQRSMVKTQQLAPKLKALQDRYKSDPQMLQRKMAEFYKEHSFNPFAGCFPLLIQMPIFIMLYSALISPQFIDLAGKSSFMFIKRLDATMKSHAGTVGDGVFGVNEHDTFSADKIVTVYLDKNKKQEISLKDAGKAVEVQGNIIPGDNVDLKVNIANQINLPFDTIDKIKQADIKVINNSTKEVEKLSFKKRDGLLVANVETEKAKTVFHFDVLILIVLFGLTMYLSQKVMTAANKSTSMDPMQKAMQDSMGQMMPIMVTGMFIFIPMPAGVLLYMVVSNVIQVIQTVLINKQIEAENPKKPDVIDVVTSDSKKSSSQEKDTKSKKQ